MKTMAMLLVSLGALRLVAVNVSHGPVRPGEWNADFRAARELAQKEHRPLLLMHTSQGCALCARLDKAIEGEAFRQWQADRNVIMSYVQTSEKDETYKQVHSFVTAATTNLPGYPYVCVNWVRADGSTSHVAFSGRRGSIGEQKNKLFSVELMAALDEVLKDYLSGAKHKSIDQILTDSVKTISVQAKGAKGMVVMHPETGMLPEGGKVTIDASPAPDSLFVCWRDPKGNIVGLKPRIEVIGSMPAGAYSAIFRDRATCPPPILPIASTSLCMRVGHRFEYRVVVDERSLPVRFKTKRLPQGVKFDTSSGVLSCKPKQPGIYSIDVMVLGSDPRKTTKKHEIVLTVQP